LNRFKTYWISVVLLVSIIGRQHTSAQTQLPVGSVVYGSGVSSNGTTTLLSNVPHFFSQRASNGSSALIAGEGGIFSISRDISQPGCVGGNAIESETIPSSVLGSGGTASSWRMFSIPYDLDDKTIATIFESVLGAYDKTKWRLLHLSNDTTFIEYKAGLSDIERGKGYWFNSKTRATISLGPGSVPEFCENNPAKLSLRQGWNQIGNPYTTTITWPAEADRAGVGSLRVFSGGTSLQDRGNLGAFQGAYVFSVADTPLNIPFDASGTRIGKKPSSLENALDQSNWEVKIIASSGIYSNQISGIGMNESAEHSKDPYDHIRVPRFQQFLDISFAHPEYFAPHFAKDVVPTTENFIWEFKVASNLKAPQTQLNWDNSYFGDNDRQLWLLDVATQTIVNMREQNSYSFSLHQERNFKVFFGSSEFITDNLTPSTVILGQNYPNPFNHFTTIPFTLAGSSNGYYSVVMDIYNMSGQKVRNLINALYSEGFYEVTWDGTFRQQKLGKGIYFVYLYVETLDFKKSLNQKIIIY